MTTDDPGLLLSARLAQIGAELDDYGTRLESLGKLVADVEKRIGEIDSAKSEIGVLFKLWENADARLRNLEPVVVEVPPVPPRKGIYVESGKLMLNGKPLKQFTTNWAGYGLDSKRDSIKRFLDELKAMGIDLVRLLHTADDISDGIDDFKPTWDEVRKGLDNEVNFIMDELAQRGMYAMLTCHHRQRLTSAEAEGFGPAIKETLFGARPANIVPGEISNLFFVFPELQALVRDVYCKEIATRYGKHPALGLVDPVNELFGTTVRGYWPEGERKRLLPGGDISPYGRAWFGNILDPYRAKYGYTDKQMTTARIVHMHIQRGQEVFTDLRENGLRKHGVTCPVGTGALFGYATRMSALAEASVGDYINVHLYSENDVDPNPFNCDVTTQRSVESVLAACSIDGKPVLLTEWGEVYQSGAKKLQRTPTYNVGPGVVAKAAARQGSPVQCHYAAAFAPLENTPEQSTVYDGFRFPGFKEEFKRGIDTFVATEPAETVEEIVLSFGDVCGTEAAGKITEPAIPGSQAWAIKAASVGHRCKVVLPVEVKA